MTRRSALAVLVGMALTVAGCSGDDGSEAEGGEDPVIEVAAASIALPAGRNTAIYFTVTNAGGGDDRLVEVRTDAGESVELHESVEGDDGLVRMHHRDQVELPAGQVVSFEPGGLHVMVFDARALDEGEVVPVELVFEHSPAVTVDAVVRSYADLFDDE